MLYSLNEVLKEWKQLKAKKDFYHYLRDGFEPQYNNDTLEFTGFKKNVK